MSKDPYKFDFMPAARGSFLPYMVQVFLEVIVPGQQLYSR